MFTNFQDVPKLLKSEQRYGNNRGWYWIAHADEKNHIIGLASHRQSRKHLEQKSSVCLQCEGLKYCMRLMRRYRSWWSLSLESSIFAIVLQFVFRFGWRLLWICSNLIREPFLKLLQVFMRRLCLTFWEVRQLSRTRNSHLIFNWNLSSDIVYKYWYISTRCTLVKLNWSDFLNLEWSLGFISHMELNFVSIVISSCAYQAAESVKRPADLAFR